MDDPSLPSHLEPPDDDTERDFERIWAALHRLDEDRAQAYDVDKAWDRLSERLDLPAEEAPASERRTDDRSPRSSTARAPDRRWRYALATTVAAVCLLVAGAWWWSQPVSVTTAAGQQTTVTLPDGSTAELNGATTLTYERRFQDVPLLSPTRRRVQLDGEAFFSVESQDRLFRVETPNAQVEVLGTTFDVRARADDGPPTTTVALASGRVRLRSTANQTEPAGVTLAEAGATSRVVGSASPTPPEMTDLKYVQAWRQGGFAIAEASLPTVLRELERRFGVSVRLRVPAAETDTMTLHYAEDVRLENILRDICVIQDLNYRSTSRGYELTRD